MMRFGKDLDLEIKSLVEAVGCLERYSTVQRHKGTLENQHETLESPTKRVASFVRTVESFTRQQKVIMGHYKSMMKLRKDLWGRQ